MVKHVAMFKLRARSPENIAQLVTAIASLREGIPAVRQLEVGADFGGTDLSYDVVATVSVDDREALEAFSRHPRHREVLQRVRSATQAVTVVDFETAVPL
jgi:hypothetical protein